MNIKQLNEELNRVLNELSEPSYIRVDVDDDGLDNKNIEIAITVIDINNEDLYDTLSYTVDKTRFYNDKDNTVRRLLSNYYDIPQDVEIVYT